MAQSQRSASSSDDDILYECTVCIDDVRIRHGEFTIRGVLSATVRKVMLMLSHCGQINRSDIGPIPQATFGSAPKATSCAARATRHLAAQPRSVLPARPR